MNEQGSAYRFNTKDVPVHIVRGNLKARPNPGDDGLCICNVTDEEMDAVDTTILSALIMGVLDATIGMIYDMQLVEIFLYGIAMVQGWFYFSTYLHKDHVSIKIMVAINLALDTAQVLMLAGAMFYNIPSMYWLARKTWDIGIYPATMYWVYKHQQDAVTILLLFEEGKLFLYRLVIVQQGLGTAIAMIIQHFYCWRIYKRERPLSAMSYEY
ncbi:hypothetical protein FISHEDRAFT_76264 [Fistulina hepatica ATCC 64428]|uniref:Uncharacterized protein n=1 Tax=Fistulina hepatica ATCC 64428 TaxID=1128425 RepID=A0A0D7A718_9AGAR|nr:hypothetical protein FISHEDRAFT_76264 [Fistulina hepatica ATCC 64428]